MGVPKKFADRRHAGRVLAGLLASYRDQRDVLVLGLPRGGVPVAFEVARALHAPLDVLLVRKLGMPGHEEFALGAIASFGIRVLNADARANIRSFEEVLRPVIAREEVELARREKVFRGEKPFPDLEGRVVLVVDDGLATGATMRAAVRALRTRSPRRIVVAVPVASEDAIEALRSEADAIVCAKTPRDFGAVGAYYDDFAQTTDAEVRALLAEG